MCEIKEGWKLFNNLEEDLKDEFTWWRVDEYGNISYKGHAHFDIDIDNLRIGNKLTHIFSKVRDEKEVLANSEFYFAFMKAVKNAGYTNITIDVTNLHKQILFEK